MSQVPLIRNGYALILNSVLTSGLGFLYWLVAARLYTQEEVGLSAALISLVTTMSGFAQLNLGSALNRFLPTAGRNSRKLVIYSYAVVAVLSLLICLVVLSLLTMFSPRLAAVTRGTEMTLWLVGGTIIWSIFVIQDGILTGLRAAVWIPLKNTVWSAGKLAVLLVLATGASYAAIFASWFLPAVAVLLVSNILIARKTGGLTESSQAAFSSTEVRTMTKFVGANYLGALFSFAAIGLPPVIVLDLLGAEANAVYFLCWTIAYTLYLVSYSLAASLMTEGARDMAKLKALVQTTLFHTFGLLALGVVAAIIAAPLVLAIFGRNYADDGTLLLQLLVLSALPYGFTCVLLTVARILGRMKVVVIANGALMVLVLGLSGVLCQTFGLIGMGMAWLTSQLVVALVLAAVTLGYWRGVSDD